MKRKITKDWLRIDLVAEPSIKPIMRHLRRVFHRQSYADVIGLAIGTLRIVAHYLALGHQIAVIDPKGKVVTPLEFVNFKRPHASKPKIKRALRLVVNNRRPT